MNGDGSVRVALLADHADMLDVLVAGFEVEWPSWYRSGNADARSDLRSRMQRDALPLALVAIRGDSSVGTVSLAANAIGPRPSLTPCLIGLWVAPSHRRTGIGGTLLRAATAEAARLGSKQLYAMTTNVPRLFHREGWRERGEADWKGEKSWIFAAF